ncbi:hypothetical protein A3A75_00220 [Candidatus Woesebacteria bacterium RIFCSPLOWO2_01_FULL_39_10]|uniref:Uncharacterized protein n=1 Tax=Candidatus Woesebacteria bacterium RIFCSPLOWO2_01_FULL_39_10 TaxID=1802516 RepID=A0A1F8B453_9BACT|nr:MAG: hypothetical protein A3A75_00220 [Candidatus Woesebacteria bacterium RIFCSPLOWO2_01_FULL_39_10]
MTGESDRLFGGEKSFNKQREGPAEIQLDLGVGELQIIGGEGGGYVSVDLGNGVTLHDRRTTTLSAVKNNPAEALEEINKPAYLTHYRPIKGGGALIVLDPLRSSQIDQSPYLKLGSGQRPDGWRQTWGKKGCPYWIARTRNR